jgi:hypothetical protein
VRIDLVVSFLLIAVCVAWAAAWWDIQRRRLSRDQSSAADELDRRVGTLSEDVADLRNLCIASRKGVSHELEQLEQDLTKDITSLRVDGVTLSENIAQHTEELAWCKQNIRDLGKAPPVAQTRPRPMPFGQKRG